MPASEERQSLEDGEEAFDVVPDHALRIPKQTVEETGAQALARTVLEPQFRHAARSSEFGEISLRGGDCPGVMDYVTHLETITQQAESGDLKIASRMLAAQAVTLDSMFTEFARRAAANMGEYMEVTESYSRLALKAQANSRATLEALVKIHQPREQTVKHVHVNEGGQAVVADEFHQHQGGVNAKKVKQSDTTSKPRTGPALLGQDKGGNVVPIPGSEGQEALQDARRNKPRSAER